MNVIRIHPADNVAVALTALDPGTPLAAAGGALPGPDGRPLAAAAAIPAGHKVALAAIPAGAAVVKYGCPIGTASAPIAPGDWVHTHNLRTGLSGAGQYAWPGPPAPAAPLAAPDFSGYLRPDGRAAVRNEIWILPTVGCVNGVARQLAARNQHLVDGSVDGLYAFCHPFGCSQLGDDHARTRRVLAALARHPNAGGVLVVGLGCENLTMDQFRAELGPFDPDRVKFLVCQDSPDELAEGSALLARLADYARSFVRRPVPASRLVIGLKCGGSDGLSGITANPAVGRVCDRLTAIGGTAILTEVPEMFGAESLLFSRCVSRDVFDRAVAMVSDFKEYFLSHGQPVSENPSPGNKAGGITTLEDKSCGCVQKGGTAPVTDVLAYGQAAGKPGLTLLSGPGNDLVSTTALTAAGAHMILFTTGRGTPFGAPAPTLKIATNTPLARRKPGWIDFDAGPAAAGEPLDDTAARLWALVLETAAGRRTCAERAGARDIALFKDGVVL